MIREGRFYSNWDIVDYIVFPTKKSLKEYFKKTNGFQCWRSKKGCYSDCEEIYENSKEEYGYEILEVEIYENVGDISE